MFAPLHCGQTSILGASYCTFLPHPKRAYRELYQRFGVGAALHPGEEPHLRLCPHIYNTMDEVEKVLKALREVSARNA